MNLTHLGSNSPSKGNQGTTRGKEKFLLTSAGNRTHDLRIQIIPFTQNEKRATRSIQEHKSGTI